MQRPPLPGHRGCNTPSRGSEAEDFGAKEGVSDLPDGEDPPDRSRSAMGLTSAWPPADLIEALRAGAAEAIDRFIRGDVFVARKQWKEVGRLLSREPPGHKGEARFVTHAGRTLSVSAWARELGWTRQALSYRLAVMPIERAMVPRKK